jgi:mannose-6-phosphate isomerase
MPIYRLDNVVQTYAWGSTTAIAELLGQPSPAAEPQAELWMGTHPKGPSSAVADHQRLPLGQLIEQQPVEILGPHVAATFDNTLPYLFKVLAAARPLSIQAHPSKAQAIDGFARENQAGKAIDAPDRNYRDANHKPEIICALTPFWGLNGFRSTTVAADFLEPVCPPELEDVYRDLRRYPEAGLQAFFQKMMTLSAAQRLAAAGAVVQKARRMADRSPVYRWMVDLAAAYPDDMGVLSPALLNLICLDPGQAMYLPAGQLHAYLDGVGIELMANSDNVLRGGLTPKHVDVTELLNVVDFAETRVERLTPVMLNGGEFGYPCPATEFRLSIIRPASGRDFVAPSARSVEMLLCTSGNGRIVEKGGQRDLRVRKGDSFLVPASLVGYTIRGDLLLYKAAVPLPGQ